MKIKIGYLYYKIIEVPYVDTDGASVLNGEVNHDKLHIQIRESIPNAKKREVILHEILHAIADNSTINLDEDQIETLAVGLSSFLIDNLEYVKRIIKEVELDIDEGTE